MGSQGPAGAPPPEEALDVAAGRDGDCRKEFSEIIRQSKSSKGCSAFQEGWSKYRNLVHDCTAQPVLRQCPMCASRVRESRFKQHCLRVHRVGEALWNDYSSGKVATLTVKPAPRKAIIVKAKNSWTNKSTPKKKTPKKLIAKGKAKTKRLAALEKKRNEMKEVFRDIDAWNFPIGARLTSNSSGSRSQGGGYMSNRRKF